MQKGTEHLLSMQRPYQITAVIFLLAAAFIAAEALKLRYYTPLGPGPGFFSFWLALILGALALAMFSQATAWSAEPMPLDFFAARSGYLRMGAVVLALIGTTTLLNPLGFRLTMFAVNLFLLSVLGRQGPLLTLLVAVAGSFGVFHVFDRWLMVPLPVGVFGL